MPSRSNGAHAAAVGLAAVWLTAACVFPVSISLHTVTVGDLPNLRQHRSNALCHLILIDGVAPILLWSAAAPAIRRLRSVDATFAAALSGISACVVSVVQLGVGIWLIYGHSDYPVAQFAGVRTINELTGIEAALLAVAVITFVTPWSTPTGRRTHHDLWLAATSGALAVTALGYLVSSDALARTAWISVPLLVLAVGVIARDGTAQQASSVPSK